MRPLRSFPVTFLLPARSRCIHRPAKRAHSPSSPSVCFALPLQHSPATTGRSTFTALRRHPAKPLTAPCRPLSVPHNPGPTSSCLPARTLQRPSAYVHDPHHLSCASPDPRRLTFPIPAPNTSSSVPRARASTARHFTFLLISCLPIPSSLPIHRSHQSRSPRTLSKLVYHTAATASPFQHPRHRCPARHALPSASSPM